MASLEGANTDNSLGMANIKCEELDTDFLMSLDDFDLQELPIESFNFDDMLMDDGQLNLIKEEVQSWHGSSSSTSSSPTFAQHCNSSDSDEEKYQTVDPYSFLNDVRIESNVKDVSNRDTPSPSSSSTSSGCFSETSNGSDPKHFYESPVSQVTQIQPILVSGHNFQIVHVPSLFPLTTTISHSTPVPIQIQPQTKPITIKPKPVILASKDQNNNSTRTNSIPVRNATPSNHQQKTALVPMRRIMATEPAKPLVRVESRQETKVLQLDERINKKQQRIIKNRESACLSRIKKKEYVTSLESSIQELNKENIALKNENKELKNRLRRNVCSRCSTTSFTHNIMSGLSMKTTTFTKAKKNTALLLAMIITVSLNFGSINNMLSPQVSPEQKTILKPSNHEPGIGRHILWVDDEVDRNKTLNPFRDNDTIDLDYNSNTTSSNSLPICPTTQQFINQTENIRIASDLRKWIGDPEYLNDTKIDYDLNNFLATLEGVRRASDESNLILKESQKKYLKYRKQKYKNRRRAETKPVEEDAEVNQIQVFRPGGPQNAKYAELFEELRRRDDTFYVVSFNADHLMLPALSYNKTKRPKMSLMFPAIGLNDSFSDDHIMMMQIDCEVLDTSLIRIREKLIPEHLKRFQNVTSEAESDIKNKMPREEEEVRKEFGPTLQNNGSERNRKTLKPYVLNKKFDNTTKMDEHNFT